MQKRLTLKPDTPETREAVFRIAGSIEGDESQAIKQDLPRARITFEYFEGSGKSPASVKVSFDGMALFTPSFKELERVLKETRPDIELVLTKTK